MKNEFDKRAIGAMRYIGLKAIQEAKGGHVGMAISAAPITYTLFTKFININPEDGKWINRDRFVLSGGHGSMSLYPIFYLSGLMKLKDIKDFKTKDSKTPGHPEFEKEKDNFIDASTGPLGQGFAMGVGLALAQKHAEIQTKRKFPGLFTNYTYVVCGDGDLQEGISYEAMAIAGKYNLSKLIVLHDSNKYQLDSAVSKVSVENLKLRAQSNGWFYLRCTNDPTEIEQCIKTAKASGKPSFIEVSTVIAEGLAIGNSNKGHHGTISDDDLEQFKRYHDLNFEGWNIDQDILDYFKKTVADRGQKAYKKWEESVKGLDQLKEFKDFTKILSDKFEYDKIFGKVKISKKDQATRVYLKEFLASLEEKNPFAIATCADLVASTNVAIGTKTIDEGGQSLPLGVREFSMAAIINGITLFGCGFRAIGGTFLAFSDYMKSAIRLSSLMKIPSVFAFTHDSYLVGGDGPTHQPYDQIPMLRAIESHNVYRPADEEELRHCLIDAFSAQETSSTIIMSRQNIKSLEQKNGIDEKSIQKGFNIVKDSKDADYIIAASGAEVQLALEVAEELKNVRVVSVPCLDKVVELGQKEIEKLFKAKKALVTIEPSSDYKWYRLHLSDQKNIHIGAYTFGKSMDGDVLYKEKGFSKEAILKQLD